MTDTAQRANGCGRSCNADLTSGACMRQHEPEALGEVGAAGAAASLLRIAVVEHGEALVAEGRQSSPDYFGRITAGRARLLIFAACQERPPSKSVRRISTKMSKCKED